MIVIQDTIISPDLVDTFFCCNPAQCLGMCCIEGESGAPVEAEEIERLEEVLPLIKNDLTDEALQVIEQQGVAYIDADGDFVTSIVNGKDCVFACRENDKICRCAIEKAYRAGKTDFFKPVSCHLYPVRVTQYSGYRAVNLHRWSVCDSARTNGVLQGIRAFRFLKEPLVRKFGEEWYKELEGYADGK